MKTNFTTIPTLEQLNLMVLNKEIDLETANFIKSSFYGSKGSNGTSKTATATKVSIETVDFKGGTSQKVLKFNGTIADSVTKQLKELGFTYAPNRKDWYPTYNTADFEFFAKVYPKAKAVDYDSYYNKVMDDFVKAFNG